MRYRHFGNTGLCVFKLCLGAMTFGSRGFWKALGGLQQSEVGAPAREFFAQGQYFGKPPVKG